MSLKECPNCSNEILSRLGTTCPNCGFTVGYFDGDKRRKRYGKLFALTVFSPFISFFTIIFTQLNQYLFSLSILFAIFLAVKSIPLNFKDVFASRFEKIFFWSIWIVSNSFLLVLALNIFYKS